MTFLRKQAKKALQRYLRSALLSTPIEYIINSHEIRTIFEIL